MIVGKNAVRAQNDFDKMLAYVYILEKQSEETRGNQVPRATQLEDTSKEWFLFGIVPNTHVEEAQEMVKTLTSIVQNVHKKCKGKVTSTRM